MHNLSRDPRTRRAYKDAVKRRRSTDVDPPPKDGLGATVLLDALQGETCEWIGYGVTDSAANSQWWTVALTPTRLLVGEPRSANPVRVLARGDWSATSDAHDVILDARLPEGRLRLRGAGTSQPGTFSGNHHRPEPDQETDSGPATFAHGAPTGRVEPLSPPTTTQWASPRSVVSTWQEAEELALGYMRQMGFVDARLTGSGIDGGVDVIASDAIAQVKHYSASVGAPVIQQLKGAAHDRDWACFFALSGYTEHARRYAETANVALFSYTIDGDLFPESSAARFLARLRSSDERPDLDDLAREAKAAEEAMDYLERAMKGFVRQAQDALALSGKGKRGEAAASAAAAEVRRLTAKYEAIKERGVVPLSEVKALTEEFLAASDRVVDSVVRAHRIF